MVVAWAGVRSVRYDLNHAPSFSSMQGNYWVDVRTALLSDTRVLQPRAADSHEPPERSCPDRAWESADVG